MAHCESCKNAYKFDVCLKCKKGSNFEELRLTNADRIRAMSDEELADVLGVGVGVCHLCIHRHVACCTKEIDCRTGILKWLKSEVKEEK